MTNEEFICRIRKAVYEPAVEGSIAILEQPPGRRPPPALVELSLWYKRLSPEDKQHLRATIQLAARKAVFGMLTVLDGERSICEAEEDRGSLELRFNTKRQSVLLNDPAGEPLHDIFGNLVPPW